MSCFEQSTFIPDHEVIDQEILQAACDQLGWHYQIRGKTLTILSTGSRGSRYMGGEAALEVRDNRVIWNTYYTRDGIRKRDALREKYTAIFLEMRVTYAKTAVLAEFRSRGFNKVDEVNFVPTAEVKHRFYLKGRSKLRNESEPNAKIRISILADGTLQTDSNYIPEDIHALADEALEAVAALLGTKREIKPKEIPAKYRNKAFCKRNDNIQLRQKGK